MTEKKSDKFKLELNKETLSKIPIFVRGMVENWVKDINTIDLDKNGQADVEQYGPYVLRALPLIFDLFRTFDPGRTRNFIIGSGLVASDKKGEAKEILDQLLGVVEEAKVAVVPESPTADLTKNV